MKRSRTDLVSLPFFIVAALGGGCNESIECTERGCRDAFTVVYGAQESLNAGDYVFLVETPDGETECDVTFPDPGNSAASLTQVCDGPDQISFTNTSFSVSDSHDAISIRIEAAASGETVEESFRPEYLEERPNGPSCEPACQVGNDTMSVGELVTHE